VSAVTRSEVGIVENTNNEHYFQGVIACRMSHIRALDTFLSSTNDFGLILEDDFLFSQKFKAIELLRFQEMMLMMNVHLLQIGFLPKGASLPAFFSIPISIFTNLLKSLSLFLTYRNVPIRISHEFLPGSHAYIVNREMASYLIENAQSDVKIPIDLWIRGVAKSKKSESTLIGRLQFSVVSQNRDFESDLQF
jgi:GR25 family glycosyltransferase involved in LPS biosynthesis